MNYKISMPHHYEIIYEDSNCKISFETELAVNGIIFYVKSAKITDGTADNTSAIIDRVKKWLDNDSNFKEIIYDYN